MPIIEFIRTQEFWNLLNLLILPSQFWIVRAMSSRSQLSKITHKACAAWSTTNTSTFGNTGSTRPWAALTSTRLTPSGCHILSPAAVFHTRTSIIHSKRYCKLCIRRRQKWSAFCFYQVSAFKTVFNLFGGWHLVYGMLYQLFYIIYIFCVNNNSPKPVDVDHQDQDDLTWYSTPDILIDSPIYSLL